MATSTVKVPINGNDPHCRSWIYNVSQHIDAGNDVMLVDELDGSTPVEVSNIHLDTDGSIAFHGKAYDATAAVSISLAAGGFHSIGGIHKILKAGTSANAGIHIKV
jgi:hypothetical protein